MDLGHFIQVLERQVELLQLQGQAIAIIIIIYILEITMEKFKIFNKILILLLIMNLYVYVPIKDNFAYSQPIKANQVFFDGLKGEEIW